MTETWYTPEQVAALLITALQRLLDLEARMTPGPWMAGFFDDEPGALHVKVDGQRCMSHLGTCEETVDAQAIVAFRNVARPLVEALIALDAERRIRLNVDEDPHFFDRLYALQEASDAALARLTEITQTSATSERRDPGAVDAL